MERLLNKREVAEAFGVTVKAIDKWVCEKKIPYLKLSKKCVRFIPSEIRAYINKLRIKPEAAVPPGSAAKSVAPLPGPAPRVGRPRRSQAAGKPPRRP